MRLPNKRLVSQLQRNTEAYFYGDRAVLISYTITGRDELNVPIKTTVETTLNCSFTEKPTKSIWKDQFDISVIDAEIRFVGDKPNKGDRIKLVSRFDRGAETDQVYEDQTFEILAINDRDVFGYVVALKRVYV